MAKSKSRWSRFSVRFLLVVIAVFAITFSYFVHRRRLVQQHQQAITDLRELRAPILVIPWATPFGPRTGNVLAAPEDAPDTKLAAIGFDPSVSVPFIDFRSASYTPDEIRKFIPTIRKLIPQTGDQQPGSRWIAIALYDNPHADADLAQELAAALPNCRVSFGGRFWD